MEHCAESATPVMLHEAPNVFPNRYLRLDGLNRTSKLEEKSATRIAKSLAFTCVGKSLARKTCLNYRGAFILSEIELLDIARNNIPI